MDGRLGHHGHITLQLLPFWAEIHRALLTKCSLQVEFPGVGPSTKKRERQNAGNESAAINNSHPLDQVFPYIFGAPNEGSDTIPI